MHIVIHISLSNRINTCTALKAHTSSRLNWLLAAALGADRKSSTTTDNIKPSVPVHIVIHISLSNRINACTALKAHTSSRLMTLRLNWLLAAALVADRKSSAAFFSISCCRESFGLVAHPCTKQTKLEREHSEGRKEMFYLTTHSTHFIFGYMGSDIW